MNKVCMCVDERERKREEEERERGRDLLKKAILTTTTTRLHNSL